MAEIVIKIPIEVYNAIRTLANAKGIDFNLFCQTAFAAGLNKNVRKKWNKSVS